MYFDQTFSGFQDKKLNHEFNKYILYLFDIASGSDPLRGYVCPWPHVHSQPRVRSRNFQKETFRGQTSSYSHEIYFIYLFINDINNIILHKLIKSRKGMEYGLRSATVPLQTTCQILLCLQSIEYHKGSSIQTVTWWGKLCISIIFTLSDSLETCLSIIKMKSVRDLPFFRFVCLFLFFSFFLWNDLIVSCIFCFF